MRTHNGPRVLLALTAFILTACGGGSSGGNASHNVPATSTVTRTFLNKDFTSVEIRNSFELIVQHGDHFAIEITVDSDDIDLVKVSQDGSGLRVEFDPAYQGNIETNTAFGIITLPALHRIELSGSAFADVAGFEQSSIEIAQSGSSQIVVSNSRLDFVTVTLDGSSHLKLTDIAAIPAAHVVTSGSSQATLSMMDAAGLTGSASGSSNISYYGNGVFLGVTTSNSATVTWLGVLTGQSS